MGLANPDRQLLHVDKTEKIIGCYYDVLNELGPGFLESVYERSLVIALRGVGLEVESQVALDVRFRGQVVGEFRADIVVDKSVLLEIKAGKTIDRSHEAQLLNYLQATGLSVGMIFNFGAKPEFKRLIRTLHARPTTSIELPQTQIAHKRAVDTNHPAFIRANPRKSAATLRFYPCDFSSTLVR